MNCLSENNLGSSRIILNKALLGNTKGTLVSIAIGTAEIKEFVLILLSTAWWVIATPISIDHAGTVILKSYKTAE